MMNRHTGAVCLIFLKNCLTRNGKVAIMKKIQSAKLLRKSSSEYRNFSESSGWWNQGREWLSEWTFEGGLNRDTLVDADGNPPVIHRACVMAHEASGRNCVNLGGIAGVQLLSHGG